MLQTPLQHITTTEAEQKRSTFSSIKDGVTNIFNDAKGITEESLKRVGDYFGNILSQHKPDDLFTQTELSPKPGTYSKTILAENTSTKGIPYTINGFVFSAAIDPNSPTKTPIHNHKYDCFSYLWKGDVVEVNFSVEKDSQKENDHGIATPTLYSIREEGSYGTKNPSDTGQDTHAILNFANKPAILIHVYAHDSTMAPHANKEFPHLKESYGTERYAKETNLTWAQYVNNRPSSGVEIGL